MKPLVIYHANCADGFGAAFAAWLKLGDEAEYCPRTYGKEDPLPEYEDREIFILDFSFPRSTMDAIFALAKSVVWLDHHKTAFEMWIPDYDIYKCAYHTAYNAGKNDNHGLVVRRITLDNNKSGALIAWEYFHPCTEVPMLIQHIDDYDRWQFKLDGTKAFNKALWSYAPWSFEQWQEQFLNGAADLIPEGEAILRAHDQNVQSVVKGSARGVSFGVQTGVMYSYGSPPEQEGFLATGLSANCPAHLTSDVGHELAVQSGSFGLCWMLNQKTMNANCSLRSNGDYDVSAIAKAFGGGGHKNAAGFEVPIETLLSWLR